MLKLSDKKLIRHVYIYISKINGATNDRHENYLGCVQELEIMHRIFQHTIILKYQSKCLVSCYYCSLSFPLFASLVYC